MSGEAFLRSMKTSQGEKGGVGEKSDVYCMMRSWVGDRSENTMGKERWVDDM